MQCLFSVKTKTFADLVESRKKNDNETPCAFKFSLFVATFSQNDKNDQRKQENKTNSARNKTKHFSTQSICRVIRFFFNKDSQIGSTIIELELRSTTRHCFSPNSKLLRISTLKLKHVESFFYGQCHCKGLFLNFNSGFEPFLGGIFFGCLRYLFVFLLFFFVRCSKERENEAYFFIP